VESFEFIKRALRATNKLDERLKQDKQRDMLKMNDYAYMRSDSRLQNPINLGSSNGASYPCPTVEHAFQASKATDPQMRERICKAETVREARSLGRNVQLPNDWESKKYFIMETLVEAKFLANPDIAKLLIDTGDESLEMNHDIDEYWGCREDCGITIGENRLGEILVNTREKLKVMQLLIFDETEEEPSLINVIKKIIPEKDLSEDIEGLFNAISDVLDEANDVWSAQCASLDGLKKSINELGEVSVNVQSEFKNAANP